MASSKEAHLLKEIETPRLAVDVAIFNERGEVLLGKRLVAEGFGTWGFPGGRMQPNERIYECAQRELREELGDKVKVEVTNEILAVRENNIPPNFIPHITIILQGRFMGGEPQIMEPDKCSEWRFIPLNEIHKYPLFSGVLETLTNHKEQKFLVVTDWHKPK